MVSAAVRRHEQRRNASIDVVSRTGGVSVPVNTIAPVASGTATVGLCSIVHDRHMEQHSHQLRLSMEAGRGRYRQCDAQSTCHAGECRCSSADDLRCYGEQCRRRGHGGEF